MKCNCNGTKDVYIQKPKNVYMPVGQNGDDFPFYHKEYCDLKQSYKHLENCFKYQIITFNL